MSFALLTVVLREDRIMTEAVSDTDEEPMPVDEALSWLSMARSFQTKAARRAGRTVVAKITRDRRSLGSALAELEHRYVQALNAVLVCPNSGGSDAYRWRGHAEAYRQSCELLRSLHDLEWVDYRDSGWRTAHGVYTAAQLAEMGVEQ
jgi:hypothetical protein